MTAYKSNFIINQIYFIVKIQLITPEQHETLLAIQKEFPTLTLQNNGYESINKDSLTDQDKE